MKHVLISVILLLSVCLFSETCIEGGGVSGVWELADSPFIVTGKIRISINDQLIIEPGVSIKFNNQCNLVIKGSLMAAGTETDSILFTSTNDSFGWGGLKFVNTDSAADSSFLKYCTVEKVNACGNYWDVRGGAVQARNSSNLLIENCIIKNNLAAYGGGIYIRECSPTVRNSMIINNSASHDGGGILCSTGSNSLLEDLIIDNNVCSYDGGGLFICNESSPILRNMTISNNRTTDPYDGSGAGISIWASSPMLEDLRITGNHSVNGGGGLEIIDDSYPVLNNVMIDRNRASSGAGIIIHSSILDISNSTICFNEALYRGGGLYIQSQAIINFDETDRNSIYLNNCLEDNTIGNDLYISSVSSMNVIVDTFTVMEPDEYYAYPPENFTFDILDSMIDPVTQDVYVNVNGSDSNSGLTDDDPFRTITHALRVIVSNEEAPYTIHLADGVYSELSNGELFPVKGKNHIIISGESRNGTILDGNFQQQLMRFNNLEGIKIQNLTLENGLADSGAGLSSTNCQIELDNLNINNNTAVNGGGGGMYFSSSQIELSDLLIENNVSTTSGGGGFGTYYCSGSMANVTVKNNSSHSMGGGINFGYNSEMSFDPVSLCSIYNNRLTGSYSRGFDLSSNYNNTVSVIVDTFTVMDPTVRYAEPLNVFTFEINSVYLEQIYEDLYVNPTGSDSNTGTSPGEPLKTIQYALERIAAIDTEPRTIFLSPGLYSPSASGENFPLHCKENVSIIGAGEEVTILDAENLSLLITVEVAGVVISDLTLMNGNDIYTGGIALGSAEIALNNIIIRDCSGQSTSGGISCNSSEVLLENVDIFNNHSIGGAGGLSVNYCDPYLKNVRIHHNTAESSYSGGAYFNNSNPIFDSISKCSIFMNSNNSSWQDGSDLGAYSCVVNTVLDTFTVLYPDQYFAYPFNAFQFDIENGYIEQVDADLFVSPDGSDLNGGLSIEDPLKTISHALLKINPQGEPRTIYLDNGTYSTSSNNEEFPIKPRSNITLSGAGRKLTEIDCEWQSNMFICNDITNFKMQFMTCMNTYSESYNGAPISSNNSDISLYKVDIHNNIGTSAGALRTNEGEIRIEKCGIYNNSLNTSFYYYSGAGAILTYDSHLQIINSTIYGNNASYGYGSVQLMNANVEIVNSILWDNTPNELYLQGYGSTYTLYAAHSDIENGEEGIVIYGYNVIFEDNVIDTFPGFTDSNNGDLTLTSNSPCIDSGIAFLEWDGSIIVDIDEVEITGLAPDMGAYEYDLTGTDDEIVEVPDRSILYQNFPNPFNPKTVINFQLSETSDQQDVELIIYNIKGQKVKELIKDKISAGKHSVIWDGQDTQGRSTASGIYFYKLKIDGEKDLIKKCLLLK